MTRRRTPLAALAAVTVLVVGGCGDQAPDATPTEPSTPTAADGTGSQHPSRDVVSVTVHQTGGLAGIDETTTVEAGSPGSGRVLALAGRLRDAPPPVSKQAPCCDRITYRVSIRYADGGTAGYVTWDGDAGRVLTLATSVLSGAGTR